MFCKVPLITNDSVVLGILCLTLVLVFAGSASRHPLLKKIYAVVPATLLCYFIPGLLNTAGVISGDDSSLYPVMSRYLLPASLVLFTISLDFKAIWKLRKKAGLMFLTACVSVILGGPLALYLVSAIAPGITGGQGPDAVWRGLSTIAGSWIGGGANQAAMYELFKPDAKLFSVMIAIDVVVANIWMALLLYGAGKATKIDRYLKADTTAVDDLRSKIEAWQLATLRMPSLNDLVLITGTAFAVTGLSHWLAGIIAPWIQRNAPYLEQFSLTSEFFWIVSLATLIGILLSFTKARQLEGAGASRVASLFLYLLIATIGMRMNVMAVMQYPALLWVGVVWIVFHGICLLIVARITRSPFFFVAVNSQAVIGGAASAPVVAAAFYPALAPVGVLLAIMGYACGTYGGYLCGLLMQWVSG